MPIIQHLGTAISSGGASLFDWDVGNSYTLRPSKYGSYGMVQGDWTSVFGSLSVPWNGVANTQSFTTHAEENNRSNPKPGVIVGLTGFPAGVYEFTLDGGSGADADPGFGAPGGRGVGRITISPSDIIYYCIGQGGVYTGGANRTTHAGWYYPNPGGWNGGGDAGAQNSDSCYSGSGGGSTDIRLNGFLKQNRIMVAGGGGGATDQAYMTGGAGGGFNQNGQDGGHNGNSNGAKGGTQSAGGAGAKYGGQIYETYMNGSSWLGGYGYDGSQPVGSANAAGGGGGGYYGGGGAVDESGAAASGSGGGSGYANTSLVSSISASLGGAANGNPSWTWANSSVNSSGRTNHINELGNTFDATETATNNTRMDTYKTDGTTINRRYGGNGKIKIQRIS
tara:strand:+ start:63 stop:1241 length:1179 start_codon:yes stop_codon:yes gene_type:complete